MTQEKNSGLRFTFFTRSGIIYMCTYTTYRFLVETLTKGNKDVGKKL